MVVILLMVVLSVVATLVALVAASPLFRSVTLAIDSWADPRHGQAERL